MTQENPKKKTKIEQLEELLESENSWEQQPIEILPNGEIRAVGDHGEHELKPGMKPLTFREYLGGEYAEAA
jgi:hypothetical protein